MRIDIGGPSCDLRPQLAPGTDAALAQALAGPRAQLAIRRVQPVAVLRRAAELDPTHQFSRPLRLERRVERSLRVRVQLVQHQRHSPVPGVAPLLQARHLVRPNTSSCDASRPSPAAK